MNLNASRKKVQEIAVLWMHKEVCVRALFLGCTVHVLYTRSYIKCVLLHGPLFRHH